MTNEYTDVPNIPLTLGEAQLLDRHYKKHLGDIDRLIFNLTNKGCKKATLREVYGLEWSLVAGSEVTNREFCSTYMDESSKRRMERRTVVDDTLEANELYLTQNSFDWTVKELLSQTFSVGAFPKHTRKNIKLVEGMFAFHHGLKLDWEKAAEVAPEFFPPSSITAPNRPRGAVYRHRSRKRATWYQEDLIVTPMLVKLKLLRIELMSFINENKLVIEDLRAELAVSDSFNQVVSSVGNLIDTLNTPETE